MKGSDNPFPSLLFAAGDAPPEPSAGQVRIFVDDVDGLVKAIDSDGTVIVLGDASGAVVPRTINAQTGMSYTLVLGDAGDFVTMTNASASTLTVPPNSDVAFPVGTLIEGAQLGAGQLTLTEGAGVTIDASPGLKIADQNGTFALLKLGTNTWLAYGRLSA